MTASPGSALIVGTSGQPPRKPSVLPGACTVRAFDDIDEVDPVEWDDFLDADDLQASHRFVRACQRSGVERARYRHLMVYRGGRLEAIASLSAMQVRLDLLAPGIVRSAIEGFRRWRPSFLTFPVALGGLPVSFGQSCLRIREGAEVLPVVEMLAAELDAWATASGASLLCFKEFRSEEEMALASLEGYGYLRAPSLPFCTLPIRWRSFGEYLAAMRAGYRRQAVASLRVREEAGLTLRAVEDFGPECGRIFPLYEQVMDRAENQLERLNPAFFRLLSEELAPEARAVLVERGSRLLAVAIVLETPQAHTFLLAGIDYAHHRASHAYLNLVLELVARAIRAGVSRLDLGQTSYDLKRRLGAEAFPLAIFLKSRSRLGHLLLQQTSGLLFPAIPLPPRRVFR